jgi:hypothetical protein
MQYKILNDIINEGDNMYFEDELEEVVYNTFVKNGLAVKRELVTQIVEDIVDYMLDEGYMNMVEIE